VAIEMLGHLYKCQGEVPRKDLPPFLKGAIGIRQSDECPVCHGVGYVEGS